MRTWINGLYIAGFLSLFVACSPKIVQVTTTEKTEKHKTPFLIERLDSLNKTVPTYFYGKASTNYKDKNRDLSFKTSVKIKSDSAVNALITFAGLPIVNSIVTKDSVKYQNKKDKCYSENSIDYFRESFGYPFEYENVIQLLLGLPIAFESDNKYFQLPDNVYHILSTHRKSQLKNPEQLYVNNNTEDDIIIKYFLVNEGNTLEKVEIDSPGDRVKISVKYGNRSTQPETFNYPQLISISILTEKNEINITLEFDKLEINQVQEINYTVPKSYESCK